MFIRLIEGAVGKRFARRFAHLWKGRALQRARLTMGILAIALVTVGSVLLARRGNVSAANDEVPASSPRGVILAAVPPTASTPAVTPDPSSLRTIGTLSAAHFYQSYLNI